MSESFEDACASYGNYTWIGRDGVKRAIDRLKRAHEHDMDELQRDCDLAIGQARDPQRIGGTLERDSFAYAIEQLREFRWQHATNDDDAIPYINGVARAHEHEMEHLRKARFHEGYIAGQRSMDAEHRAVAMRLQSLHFEGGGSHGRLSEIAHAVYPEYRYGWTQGACAELRDELIRLLGGVHDDPVSVAAIGDACGDDCHRHDGETGRVSEPDSQKSPNLADTDGGEVTITDELRECVRTADRQYDDMPWYEMCEDSEADHTICLVTEGELLRIADRIDERVRLGDMKADIWKDYANQMRMERDELQAKLERSRAEYCETCEEAETSDILRAKLDAIREALDGQR